MKFIFFGSPEFAAIILEKLINADFIPKAVVCNPDKPVGRKKTITPPPVKQLLIEKFKHLNIGILQPEKLNIQDIYNWCDSTDCIYKNLDLFIVAAYGKIIPKEILEIPRLGAIGVHPSLLPKYRGATPIQTAILNGDKETGTTLYLMDEKMDHGKIISNLKFQISNLETYETLMRKLAELNANLLIETLPDIENKIKNAKTQNESEATYTKKIETEDALIKPKDLEKAQKDEGEVANEINRKIRAFYPEPGAYTFINNKRTKLLEAEIIENKLKLKKIQIEGKMPQIIK